MMGCTLSVNSAYGSKSFLEHKKGHRHDKNCVQKTKEPEYSITSCISLKLYYSLSFLLGGDLTLCLGLFSSLLCSDFGGETSCIAAI